jgi:hypothetical protein
MIAFESYLRVGGWALDQRRTVHRAAAGAFNFSCGRVDVSTRHPHVHIVRDKAPYVSTRVLSVGRTEDLATSREVVLSDMQPPPRDAEAA